MSNSFCTQCGAPLNPGVRFCTRCGAPAAAQAQPAPAVCPACGKPVSGNVRFCTACGTALSAAAAQPAPQAQPPQAPQAPQPAPPAARPAVSPQGYSVGQTPLNPGGQTPLNPAAVSPAAAVPPAAVRPEAQARQTAQRPAAQQPQQPQPTQQPQPAQQPQQARPGGQTSLACPTCGRVARTGSPVCVYCGTLLPAPAAAQTKEEPQQEIRETSGRTGLRVALITVALVVAALGAVLLIFKDKIFGGSGSDSGSETDSGYAMNNSQPPETAGVPQQSQDSGQTAPRPDTEPAPETPVSEKTEPVTEPTTEAAPKPLAWDEIMAIASSFYPDTDSVLLGESESFYTFGICPAGKDTVLGVLQVDKYTGAVTVVQEYAPEESSGPKVPGGPSEACGTEDVSIQTVRNSMQNAVGSGASYSFAVMDLYSGSASGTSNWDTPMSSSVLIGIPLLYAVNQEVMDGNLLMTEYVDVVSGKSPRGSLSGHSTMMVRDLLTAMLRDSSGDAICTLMDRIGKNRVNQICHDHGFTSVSLTNYIGSTVDNTASDNYVSSRDLCAMLYELYNGSGPVDRSYLIDNFGITSGDYQNSGLGRSLSGVVGSFNGVKTDKFNEVILVERNGRAYVMALMANGAGARDIMSGMNSVGSYVDSVLMR